MSFRHQVPRGSKVCKTWNPISFLGLGFRVSGGTPLEMEPHFVRKGLGFRVLGLGVQKSPHYDGNSGMVKGVPCFS